MVLTSFDRKDYEKMMKKKYEMIGEQRGLEKGKILGEYGLLKHQVTRKLQKGNSIHEISQALEQDEELIYKIVEELGGTNDRDKSCT